jgi:hypothetical protein
MSEQPDTKAKRIVLIVEAFAVRSVSVALLTSIVVHAAYKTTPENDWSWIIIGVMASLSWTLANFLDAAVAHCELPNKQSPKEPTL